MRFFLFMALVLASGVAGANPKVDALEARVSALEAEAQSTRVDSGPRLVLVDSAGAEVAPAFPQPDGTVHVFTSYAGHLLQCVVRGDGPQEVLQVDNTQTDMAVRWIGPGCTGAPFLVLQAPRTGLPRDVAVLSVPSGTYEAGAQVTGFTYYLSTEDAFGCRENEDPDLFAVDAYEAVAIGPALDEGFNPPYDLEVR